MKEDGWIKLLIFCGFAYIVVHVIVDLIFDTGRSYYVWS